ncbi:acetyltransferase [Polynucleobacter sp. 39-46-10]|jgi:sugar O-acyltransferase (sialic acid O-acetyltransferase NeuD family)|uniref:acetyltransferase n=1 Tax=Polynucleobacter sp. 39-46-10 TaxID=1970428 RepID=UPI000BCD95FB|nr:acetyltransferase [Polynucleobacter sp. 39-46-10]OZA77435.1 MAG: sugar O-acyltransferase [Polynucleobacter sp. 39-46-10]
MTKTKKLLIIGDSAFAEVAYECFTHDSEYEVVGFAVESQYLKRTELFGLPIVPFEQIEEHFNPSKIEFYAALVYSQLNRLRTRLYQAAKAKGYRPASYISSRAFVWQNVVVGEHCFVFEDNTIQPFVRIGNNVVLWSGNHIGHHSVIQDHCFIASHVVISGFCNIGSHTFMGVNATLGNNVSIGEDNWIGPSVTLVKDTEPNLLFKVEQPEPAKVSARRFFKVREA